MISYAYATFVVLLFFGLNLGSWLPISFSRIVWRWRGLWDRFMNIMISQLWFLHCRCHSGRSCHFSCSTWWSWCYWRGRGQGFCRGLGQRLWCFGLRGSPGFIRFEKGFRNTRDCRSFGGLRLCRWNLRVIHCFNWWCHIRGSIFRSGLGICKLHHHWWFSSKSPRRIPSAKTPIRVCNIWST